jgi:hypothetical protein
MTADIAKSQSSAPYAMKPSLQRNLSELTVSCGGAEEVVNDLKAKVFPQREMKFLVVGTKRSEARTI